MQKMWMSYRCSFPRGVAWRIWMVGLVFGLSIGVSSMVWAVDYNRMFVFGDSLSDVGNTSYVTRALGSMASPASKPNLYYPNGSDTSVYNQRFSNGPVWNEYLAGMIGVTLPSDNHTAVNNQGTNFAYGGAFSNGGLTEAIGIYSVSTQISGNQTLGYNRGFKQLYGSFEENDLALIWGGANDFILGRTFLDNEQHVRTAAETAVENIKASVLSLISDYSAKNIAVFNLPDIGLTPRYLVETEQWKAWATLYSDVFNEELSSALGAMILPVDVNLVKVDIESFFADAIANPDQYNLMNVTQAAYPGTGTELSPGVNPEDVTGYLFWDSVHPTTTGHRLLAEYVHAQLNPIPEPQMWGMLFGVACVVFLWRRRIQRLQRPCPRRVA